MPYTIHWRFDGRSCQNGAAWWPTPAVCTALRPVATSMELDVAGTVHAEGDLDFRGTLGVDREAAVGFTAIRLRFDLASDASEEELDKLLERTERYCVVGQTLAAGVPVEFTY